MDTGLIEKVLRLCGGILDISILLIILVGIIEGSQHPAGRKSGWSFSLLRSIAFYLFLTIIFLVLSAWGWKPLPLRITSPWHLLAIVVAAILYFPGLALVAWGRLVLGSMYFVSTSFSAQLFSDHQLVTNGPYALVRHPMYLGLIMAALGSLLLYHTWTSLFFAFFTPFLLLRARREEQVLSTEFSEAWQKYASMVPAIIPRLIKKH